MRSWISIIVIMVAFTSCSKDNTDLLLIGRHIGQDTNEAANDLVVVNKNIYACGYIEDPSLNQKDAYLVRYDYTDDELIEVVFEDILKEEAMAITSSQDGNILMASTIEDGIGNRDIRVRKIDLNGAVIWQSDLAFEVDAIPADILQEVNGQIRVLGTVTSDQGDRDLAFGFLSNEGIVMDRTIIPDEGDSGGSSMVSAPQNKLAVLGYRTSETGGDRDIWVFKLDLETDLMEWSNSFGGLEYEESQSIALTPDNDFVICGHSASVDINHNFYLAKIDNMGELLWERNLGGSNHDGAQAVAIVNDKIVCAARTMSGGDGKGREILLTKFNTDGLLLGAEVVGEAGDDWIQRMVADESGYYFAGYSDSRSLINTDLFLGYISN